MVIASCKKNKDANIGYIPECSNITKISHPSMIDRNDACKSCCISNNYETGMYDEGLGAAKEGCECFD